MRQAFGHAIPCEISFTKSVNPGVQNMHSVENIGLLYKSSHLGGYLLNLL